MYKSKVSEEEASAFLEEPEEEPCQGEEACRACLEGLAASSFQEEVQALEEDLLALLVEDLA